MTRLPALSDASSWPLSSSAKVGAGTKKTTGPHNHSTTAALCRCHMIDMPSAGANERPAGRTIRKVGLAVSTLKASEWHLSRHRNAWAARFGRGTRPARVRAPGDIADRPARPGVPNDPPSSGAVPGRARRCPADPTALTVTKPERGGRAYAGQCAVTRPLSVSIAQSAGTRHERGMGGSARDVGGPSTGVTVRAGRAIGIRVAPVTDGAGVGRSRGPGGSSASGGSPAGAGSAVVGGAAELDRSPALDGPAAGGSAGSAGGGGGAGG